MEITLKLNIDQVNTIIGALGELPVKSGVGMLIGELINQVQPQLTEESSEETQSNIIGE